MSFGRYRELALLGHGGMARVVLAALPGAAGVQKLLVIKEMLPELARDPEFIGLFTDEARVATRLDHPNLIQTYEFNEHDGHYFFAMEYLEGQPYSAFVAKLGARVPLAIHLHVLTRVLAGLHYAHELTDLAGKPLGIVHRDVSPQNVFLCYGGAIKLVDFGIAKADGAQVKTKTGVFRGKVGYAAPEQIGGVRVDRRADIFAVGVLLWEALARRRITQGETNEAVVIQRRVAGLDPKIADVAPEAPPALLAICARAMAHDRDARFQTARDMQIALEAFIEESGLRATDAEVGETVAHVFEAERSHVRKLVQERLRAPQSTRLPTPRLVIPTPLAVDDPVMTEASVSIESSSPGRIASRHPLALVAVFVGTACFGATALWFATPRGHHATPAATASIATTTDATAPAPASAPTSSAEAPPPDAAPIATVEYTLRATPKGARFVLDGRELEGNPAKANLPSDKNPHTLRIEANGYVAQERTLAGDRSTTLELMLARDTNPKSSEHPRSGRTAKPIDTADPWTEKKP